MTVSNKKTKIFPSKRHFSILPKFQKRNSNQTDQTQSQLTENKIYPQNQSFVDEMEKFLTSTKSKLYSSTRQLNQFHIERQNFTKKKQNIDFSLLNDEIKHTKFKIINRNSRKKINSQQNSQILGVFQDQKDFNLQIKFVLLQRILSQEQKASFKQQIVQKIKKIKKQNQQNKLLCDKILKYYLNYEVVSKILTQIAKDTQKMIIRQQNINQYLQMKEEMVALLSNQEHFYQIMREMEKNKEIRKKDAFDKCFTGQTRRVQVRRKPKNSLSSEKSLQIQIEEMLEISKKNIKEAFLNFEKPQIRDQIDFKLTKKMED